MPKITVKHSLTIPRAVRGRVRKWPLDEMERGDYFVAPKGTTYQALYSSIRNFISGCKRRCPEFQIVRDNECFRVFRSK